SHVIDGTQCGENLCAFVLCHQRSIRSFQLTHRSITVDGNHQGVAKSARLFQITHMAHMQNVKDAIRENERLAFAVQAFTLIHKIIVRQNLSGHEKPNLTFSLSESSIPAAFANVQWRQPTRSLRE